MPATLTRSDFEEQQISPEPDLRIEPHRSFGLRVEIWLPWICFGAAFAVAFFCPYLWLLRATWKDNLLDKVIGACAILVAYLLTAATVLPAVEDKNIVRKLREWKYYNFVLRYISRAALSAGIVLLLSLACIPFTGSLNSHLLFNRFFSAAWWGTLTYTVAAVYIASSILFRLLRAR